MEFSEFVKLHEPQLKSSGIPENLWPTLHRKLEGEVFDAGEHLGLFQVEDEENEVSRSWKVMVTSEEGLSPSASPSSALFLVDHAWTYRIDQHGSPRSQLHQIPGLLERMASLMDIAVPSALDATSRGALVSEVLTEAWRFNHTYHIGNDEASVEASLPIWYLMDEVGTRIQHSDTPTARVAPFFSAASGYALSVVWLLCDLDHMDEVTRDFAMGVADPERRRLLLLPWAPLDVTTISPQPKQVSENFFRAARKNETLPKAALVPPRLPGGRKIRVYAEYEFVESFLTHPRFEIVTSAAAADILWLRSHVKDYESLSDESPDRFVNQFPYEHVLTVKDLLAVVCRRGSRHGVVLDEKTMSSSPPWIPLTYNLESELESFLSCFQRRENLHLDNHWILKPWNLARGLDIYITSSLDQVLKLSQTGPKIIQKYIHYPVLFHRPDVGAVKFDVRYVVMLSCVKPLKLFAFKVFWLRFANRPFSLDHYDDYQKHFTVMNYASPEKLLQMHYDEFIPDFEEQHSGFIWNELEKDIFEMIKEVFKCAVAKEPPEGLGHSPQSRALYAIDLMLSWSGEGENRKMQPQICEINFMPDCERACKYHPFFFNEVFSVLFLDEYEGLHVERLL